MARKHGVIPTLAVYLLPVLFAVLSSTGCNLFQKTDTTQDPLKGISPTTAKKGTVPPIPEPSSYSSLAAIASDNLSGGRELSISQDDSKSKPSGWKVQPGSNPTGVSSQKSEPGESTPSVLIKTPVPVIPAGPGPTSVPNPPQVPQVQMEPKPLPTQNPPGVIPTSLVTNQTVTTPSAPVFLEDYQAELKKRGVNWQRHETTEQGVRFLCAVPDFQNPNRQHRFEAIAPDYYEAVRAVLRQIDAQNGSN